MSTFYRINCSFPRSVIWVYIRMEHWSLHILHFCVPTFTHQCCFYASYHFTITYPLSWTMQSLQLNHNVLWILFGETAPARWHATILLDCMVVTTTVLELKVAFVLMGSCWKEMNASHVKNAVAIITYTVLYRWVYLRQKVLFYIVNSTGHSYLFYTFITNLLQIIQDKAQLEVYPELRTWTYFLLLSHKKSCN